MPGVKVPEEKKVMIWQGRTVDYRKNSRWNAWHDMVTVTGALHGQKTPVPWTGSLDCSFTGIDRVTANP